MADVFTAAVGGLRGPGLTDSDKSLFDARVATATAQAALALQAAATASDSAGIDRTYATKAAATGYANGELVQILADESQGGARTMYRAVGGALTFLSKVAAVNTDLSNVASGATTPGILRVAAPVANSPYYGGVTAAFQVSGLLAARSNTVGEHRIINNWGGNNTVSIQNLSNDDAYSCVRFLDHLGRETNAIGWGNTGTTLDVPYAGAVYWESSTIINADGSQTDGIVPHPMRIIQSGYQTRRNADHGESGSWTRLEISPNGDFNFKVLAPVLSQQLNLHTFSAATGWFSATFRDADDLSKNVLRIRNKNGYDRAGVVIGNTYTAGTFPFPQVALDVVGTVLAGKDVSAARPTSFAEAGVDFPFCVIDGDVTSFRHVRPGVGKYDLMFYNAASGKPLRFAVVDRDHSSLEAIWAAMDGTGAVGIGGPVGFNGATPVAKPTLPGALPTDGTATNAAMATAINAIRTALINYGLAA